MSAQHWPLTQWHLLLRAAVSKGDRVAQLILERILTPEVLEVDNLDETTRGSGGYGSTGV